MNLTEATKRLDVLERERAAIREIQRRLVRDAGGWQGLSQAEREQRK